jgi:N-acetylglutamate synthase-like GNAT family acetyltransferase
MKPSLLRRFRHFVRGPNPLHPAVWQGRLAPLNFRRLTADDIPQCLELYTLNETDRFPKDFIGEYERNLRREDGYYLVAEKEGRLIATGGISYFQAPHLAVLSFGLIRPDQQGRGVGTALLLARLSLLNLNPPMHRVFIFAVAKSVGFYKRFGFTPWTPWRDPHGQEQPSASVMVFDSDVRECRRLLAAHQIVVPEDQDRIPFKKAPTQ